MQGSAVTNLYAQDTCLKLQVTMDTIEYNIIRLLTTVFANQIFPVESQAFLEFVKKANEDLPVIKTKNGVSFK